MSIRFRSYYVLFYRKSQFSFRQRRFYLERDSQAAEASWHSFQYCLTRYSGHATSIAKKASCLGTSEDPISIIAVGGDGTIHEVLSGITDFDHVIFGYIPTGSGNDFCRSMELPSDPMESLEYILSAERISTMDVPCLSGVKKDSRFGISTGIGYDAGVCRRFWQLPLRRFLTALAWGS